MLKSNITLNNLQGITGTWYNELNSTMFLLDNNGSLEGQYKTGTGSASGFYLLAGRSDTSSAAVDDHTFLGWTVRWENNEYGDSNSTSSWSAVYRVVDGKEYIRGTWLLTEYEPDSLIWGNTKIGIDIFTRDMPTEESIAHSIAMGVHASHPTLAGEHEVYHQSN